MDNETLQPQIEKALKALETALDEASAPDVQEVDTGELIRIEESLALAIMAAKQAVSLRLRRRSRRAIADQLPTEQSQSEPRGGKGGSPAASQAATDRVFDDIRGKRWHAFAVHPSSVTVERAALPDSFLQGWLSFESSDEIRRVAPIPDKWEDLSIDDLRQLCHKAGTAPKRGNALKARPGDPKPSADQ
jgi:hypothetical protein